MIKPYPANVEKMNY